MKRFCDNCGEEITGGGVRFCSERCSRIYHKREYRKRNKEKVNAYNRKWRKHHVGNKSIKFNSGKECFFCHSQENLHWHHISWKPEMIVRLCRVCHMKLHWIKGIEEGEGSEVDNF